jgi:hypothetical protein
MPMKDFVKLVIFSDLIINQSLLIFSQLSLLKVIYFRIEFLM